MQPLNHTTHHTDETVARSLVKAASYCIVVALLDGASMYLWSGKVWMALALAVLHIGVVHVCITVAYVVHERVWDRIRWGRRIFERQPHEHPPDEPS